MRNGVRSGTHSASTQWDRVHGARRAHRRRQRQRQLGVVHDGARQHARILARELALAVAHSPDRGRLGAGIGGGQRDDRQRQIARDDLGKPDRRTAAGCDKAFGAGGTRRRESCFRDRLWHMNHRLCVQTGRARAKDVNDLLAQSRAAPRRRDYQRAGYAEP
jgi:hypothetical protein